MNAIHVKYSTLFSLGIRQLYYANGIGPGYRISPETDMDILPTEATVNTLRRLDMIFKRTDRNAGFTLLANTIGKSGPNDVLRVAPGKGDRLSFFILFKKAASYHYNLLPMPMPANSLLYFSNEVGDGAAPRANLHLSTSANGVDGSVDLIKSAGPVYRYNHNTTIVPGKARVVHRSGAVLLPESLINENGKAALVFNLLSLPEGRCSLLVDGVTIEAFYYTGPLDGLKVAGVIDLSLADVLPANYRIVEPAKQLAPARPAFTISFPNRKTIWRYVVQMQSSSPLYLQMKDLNPADKIQFLNTLKIESNDPNVVFTRSAATDFSIVFESTQPIALQERYLASAVNDPLHINFNRYPGPGTPTVLRASLPYPSTDMINALNPNAVLSEIFLTI
ncbi:hypothetical protein [Taibaiella chishuiensis]|uniref:Uncharacterized protein n=1 Tax=Taibaiella chishuiensis TaxID=1434707 RepID=A0A2P8D888_9BACT|nr:hypothetical protein [Taibaiella chishuiensis]PSK93407.1 hypothetical protein B0I18_102377 [Taibaiella chishuiensis]